MWKNEAYIGLVLSLSTVGMPGYAGISIHLYAGKRLFRLGGYLAK
jgi:hypothetical protein